jgi:pyridoxal phosphate enzyme (YggS family)
MDVHASKLYSNSCSSCYCIGMNLPASPIARERLERNLAAVREHIRHAAVKASRAPESITLVAATKYVQAPEIESLYALGLRDFGENRIQDAEQKISAVRTALGGAGTAAPVRWHLIGHLQTNKADKAARLFQQIHSVDSLRVAQALQKEAAKLRANSTAPAEPLRCLLEVNVAGETSKFGLRPDAGLIGELLHQCMEFDAIRIAGLMTMAPFSEQPESTSRPVFQKLRNLLNELNQRKCYPYTLSELSMGMTQDYTIAIEEGATLVRVGSALFA